MAALGLSEGLFAPPTEESGRDAASQAAKQRQLTAMMNGVHQELAPEQVPDAPELPIRISNLAAQVFAREACDPRNCIFVYDTERWRECVDGSRPIHIRRLYVKLELATVDTGRYVRIDFGEVPCEFAQ